MALSFLTPSRTVLLVSDEFLTIFSISSSGVKLVETVPWGEENFEKKISNIIAKDCGKKPVLIVNDMVEQHYRKERVVKTGVSFVDKSSMVARKLNVAFPNYSIRAAYPLKEKIPKTDSQPAADVYIFAAVANTDQISQTVSATKKSLASVAGFCLLPVESSDMVKALSTKVGAKKGRKKNVWSIFIGQHRNGSLRQVLTKNGELALTRMSPMTEKDDNPEVWAQELFNEFKSTMSYLTRFGYDPDDGLDVFVMANPAPGEALRAIVDVDCDLHIMTVDEAAKALGVSLGAQNDLRYADALHVAWIGRKGRFVLPMKAAEVDEVSRPRQIAMGAALLLFAGAAFLGYQNATSYGELSGTVSDINTLKRQKAQLDAQFEREVQRLAEVGFDAKLVQSSLAVYDNFEKEKIEVLEVVKDVGKALGRDLRVDKMELERAEQNIVGDIFGAIQTDENKGTPLYNAKLTMTYPSTANVDEGNKEVAQLRNRIQSLMPNNKVEVIKELQDFSYQEGIVVEAGDIDKQNVEQDFVAEIMITGMLEK
jgi:uncharacterized protein (UPF0335 family)